MGNSYSQTPIQRLVQAAGSGDVGTLESLKHEFFEERRKKSIPTSQSKIEFAKLVNSVEPTTSHTALFAACLTGGLASLEWVLKVEGVDVNTLTSTGNTALHTVVINQNSSVRRHAPHMIAALLNAGIKADHRNNRGATAVMLARTLDKKFFNSSQVLRTLEVNGSRWHGLIGVEEHGDVAKLAGSVLGLLNIGNSTTTPHDVAANTRNKISKWAGGVFRPRWGCVTGLRLGNEMELYVYESFEDTTPLFHTTTSACDLSEPLHKVARPGSSKKAIGGALDSVAAAMEGFRGHGGYAVSGLPPSDVLIRASLTSPNMSVHIQLDTPSYEALRRAMNETPQRTPTPSDGSGGGGGGGGGGAPIPQASPGQPVVAVPLSDGGNFEMAEAVVIGPEEDAIEAQVVADTYGSSPAPSAPTAAAAASSSGDGKVRGAQGERMGTTTANSFERDAKTNNLASSSLEGDVAGMSEEEMIAEAIKRSQEGASHQSLPAVPTTPLPSVPTTPLPAVPTTPLPTPPTKSASLPFNGDLQAAMRAQDRNAIRQIMNARKQPADLQVPPLPDLPQVPQASSAPAQPMDSEIEELEARLAMLRAQRSQDSANSP